MLLRSAVFRLVRIRTLRSLEEFKFHSSVKSQERALKPEEHHTNCSEVSVRQRCSNRKCACHSNWQKTCGTLYWMKKLRSQFLKISARSKIDGTDRASFFFFLRSDLVAVSCLPSFCFTWHLSDSFISPVIYLIFSPFHPSLPVQRG